jgi:hypothetical protein
MPLPLVDPSLALNNIYYDDSSLLDSIIGLDPHYIGDTSQWEIGVVQNLGERVSISSQWFDPNLDLLKFDHNGKSVAF